MDGPRGERLRARDAWDRANVAGAMDDGWVESGFGDVGSRCRRGEPLHRERVSRSAASVLRTRGVHGWARLRLEERESAWVSGVSIDGEERRERDMRETRRGNGRMRLSRMQDPHEKSAEEDGERMFHCRGMQRWRDM